MQPIKGKEEMDAIEEKFKIVEKFYSSKMNPPLRYDSDKIPLYVAFKAMEEYANQFKKSGSIKGWVKASEHLPEDKRHLEQSPIQVVVKWLHHGEFQRIDLMTLNQLADRVKAIDDPDYYEYLDETPIHSGEERLLWKTLGELKEPIEGIVITVMGNRRVFAYDSEFTLAGLKNVIRHHPEALCLQLKKPHPSLLSSEQKVNKSEK